VEVVAAGEQDDLATLAVLLKKGSRGSRVDQVVEHQLADSEDKDLGPFQIEGAW
jgi:acylphosphatase